MNADTAPPVEVDLEHSREKWTQYYLDAREIDLIREIEAAGFPMLGQLCDVRVGVVTGRNDFFVLDPSTAESLGLAEWTTRLVGRSSQIPGLQLSTADWEGLRYRNERCLLLNLRHDTRSALPARALAYVEEGERLGIHEGYKCRIRLPNWWHVPSMWVPDAFLLRQIHTGPRIVANGAGAECTDTIHRVRCHPGVSAEALAACSVNSMTWAFSEIRGRSYGGGVLELEPREACALPFPRPSASMPVDELNGLAMTGDTDALLRRVDELTLLPLGVSASEVRMLEAIWRRLSGRRLGRRP